MMPRTHRRRTAVARIALSALVGTSLLVLLIACENAGAGNGGSGGSDGGSVSDPDGAPGDPVPLDPADGATGVSIDATLQWEADGATEYDLHFSESSFGTTNPPTDTLIQEGTTETQIDPGQLSLETTYYWMVVARNANGESRSPLWSFETAGPGPLGSFSLVAPASGVAVNDRPLTFEWTAADNAYEYHFELRTSADPTSQPRYLLGQIADTSLTFDGSGYPRFGDVFLVDDGDTVYWWIVARDSPGSGAETQRVGPWSILYDESPPDVVIEGPSTGNPTRDPTPTFEVSLDPFGDREASGIVDARCRIVGHGPLVNCLYGDFTPQTALDDGTYEFLTRFTDGAGNVTDERRNFTVDTTPPVVTIEDGPTDFSTGTVSHSTEVSVTFTVDDDVAAVPEDTLCGITEGDPADLTAGDMFSCNGSPWTTTVTGFGTYTIVVEGVDAAGNRNRDEWEFRVVVYAGVQPGPIDPDPIPPGPPGNPGPF